MGLLEENVPEKYACYVCRDPPGESQQHTTWLNRNSISGFSMGLLGEGKGEVNTRQASTFNWFLGLCLIVIRISR
jgi:PHD finger protein 20